MATLSGAYGECDFERKVLSIDCQAHTSDQEIHATLLHEMAHAAAGRPGHSSPFWEQLEYLLAQGAPITVSFPELGEQGHHLCVIPARFKRCRKLFAPVYRRRQREIAQLEEQQQYAPEDLERDCQDAAEIDGMMWRDIWAGQVGRWGFVDLDGRLLPSARKWHAAARRGYRRGRRSVLAKQRARAAFEARGARGAAPQNDG